MSFIKKISFLSLFTIILAAAISSSVHALDIPVYDGSATTADIAEMNSQPEVYVKDLFLDKTTYRAGELIKGSFVLVNSKDISVSNLNYRAFLVGDLMSNSLYRYEFDSKVLGTMFLDGKEIKKVSFEYKLPLSSSAYSLGKQLGLKIRVFTGSGSPLGWVDTKVKISDTGLSPVVTSNSSVEVNGKNFKLNEGPMVYKDGKVSLNTTISNDTGKEISGLSPKISIYEMDYSKLPLITYSEKDFSLKAGSKLIFNFNLPTFNFTPKVYAGEMVIVDKDGIARTNPIQFRYIVYGEVVNIQNVSTDKLPANSGDEVTIRIDYTGNPYDIAKFTVASTTPSDFSIKLFNEKDQLVGSYTDKTSFLVQGQKDIKVLLSEEAKDLKIDLTVSKDGKIITEYKTSLIGKVVKSENDKETSNKIINYFVLIVALIIVSLGLFFLRRKRSMLVLLVIIIIGLGTVNSKAEAWTVFGLLRAWGYIPYPTITLISPNPDVVNTYLPGQTFNLSGSATVRVCNNSDYKINIKAGGITNTFTNPEPEILQQWSYNPSWPSIGETAWAHSTCGNAGAETWCGASTDFSSGPYTAPTTPGTYRIYVMAEAYFDNGGYTSASRVEYTAGYQEFTVVALTPPTLSTSAGSCGGKINLSWNAITGATSYKLYKNASTTPFATTTSLSVTNLSAAAGDTFVVKSFFGTTPSADSNIVTAVPSSSCPALTLSCSVAPNPATVNQDLVVFTAVANGGTGNYKYSWVSSPNGFSPINSSSTANSISYKYTTVGIYSATTTVSDTISTTTMRCPTTVSGSNPPGGCTSNCIDIRPPEPKPGLCGSAGVGLFATGALLGAATNRCSYTLSTSTPATFTTNPPTGKTYWSWTCSGVNGSNTPSSECRAYQSETASSTYDCATLNHDLASPVNVNNNVVWTATPKTAGAYNTKWGVVDSNNQTLEDTEYVPVVGTNTWNKLFTTTGSKTVYAKFSTSTGTGLVSGSACTSTINIVQEGGSSRER